MKRLFLLILAVTTLISCESEKKPVKDYLVLSGKVDNFRKRNMTLSGYNFKRKLKFDRKTKTFSDTLRNITPGHYTLFIGKRPVPLYLNPTNDIKISVDAKKRTKAPIYEGADAKVDDYLVKRRKKFGLILGNANKLFATDQEEFLDRMNEYKRSLVDLVEKSELPADYLAKEKRNIDYEYTRNLFNYQNFHRILTDDEEFTVNKDFPTPIDNLDFNNSEDYVNSQQYRLLLKEHLNQVAEKENPEDGDFFITYLETINKKVTNPTVKNDLIHIISEKALTYTDNMQEFYDKYMGYSTDEKNKKSITNIYNKLKLTARGMPSPKFRDYENYKGGSTSLDDLIGKGKFIYIDVWATWCGFCKKEIPLLKNFEVKYHGKNIEFVSINVDNKQNRSKWKKTIKDKEMGGVQLFGGDSHLNLNFTKDYLIKGLPRFILLDPEGKVVTANAPRPSDGDKLDKIFDELGIKSK